MQLINCEVNVISTWSKDCVITNSTSAGKFKITETKLYVLFVTLKEQLTGTNVNQVQKHMHKIDT